MDSIEDVGIRQEIAADVRRQFLALLWKRRARTKWDENDIDFDALYDSYMRNCKQATLDGGRYLSIKGHQELLWITSWMAGCRTYEEIRSELNKMLPESPDLSQTEKYLKLKGSIRLGARILAMVDTWELPDSHVPSFVTWDHGTLKDHLKDYFESKKISPSSVIKLEAKFTARNLEKIARIKILWTDHLPDHLRLVRDDTMVCVFHHISFLKWQDR